MLQHKENSTNKTKQTVCVWMWDVFVVILRSWFSHITAGKQPGKEKIQQNRTFLQGSCSSLWNLTASLNKYHYLQIALYVITILIIEDSP